MNEHIDEITKRFKKGIIPWNSGKTNVYSEETRKSMGIKNKGKIHKPLPEFRQCKNCGMILHSSMFNRPKKGMICKKCKILKEREWAKQHPENIKSAAKKHGLTKKHKDNVSLWARKNRQKLRKQIISHYSPELKCQKCGFNDLRALTIDHINGGGCEHRRNIRENSSSLDLYKWIIRNNYPNIFQILCSNCQSIKRWENKEGVKIDFEVDNV